MPENQLPTTHMTKDEAFAFLDTVARGLAATLGPMCETLVQEIADETVCTILSIYNGQVTGRRAGSTLSVYGEDTARDSESLLDLLHGDAAVCMEAVTAEGRRVKSSSWLLKGEGYILLLGVNLDITSLSFAAEVLEGLVSTGGDLRESLGGARVAGLSEPEALIEECLEQIGRPAETLNKTSRGELVRLLEERGFFEYQRAAAMLAERIGVSRNTIYNDRRGLRE